MTVYTDPLFPLPDPAFLWVYPVLIHPHDAASVAVDDNGKWVYAPSGGVAVTGYLGSPNPQEVTLAAARGLRVDAVLLVPHGTVVDEDDQLEAADATIPGIFRGTYRIGAVRPNASHVRVLLTRLSGRDDTHA